MAARRVLLVYPKFPNSYWGFQHALKLFGRKSMHSPLSLVTAAALCPKEWDYKLIDINVEPLTDEHILWADMVFVSGMTVQADSMFESLERARKLGKKTIVGGPYVSGATELFDGKADVLLLGEAESNIHEFLADVEADTLKPVYQAGPKPDMTTSPIPRYDLLKLGAYSVIDIQYSRGCPFNCEFCDIITLYGRVPRTKSPQQIIAEFDALLALGYRGPIFLVDDNFIGNVKNVRVMLPELVAWQKKHQYPFFIATEASVNLAQHPKLLEDMREAGFKRVFLGIETPSLDSLKETQKYQNTKGDLVDAVHTIIKSGLEVTAGFIVGFDSDQADIFDAQIEFIRRANIPWAMVGTLSAIKGTQLWDRLEKEGRLIGYNMGDQFGRPNFRTKMDPDLLHAGYLRILRTVYTPAAYFDRARSSMDMIESEKLPKLDEKNYPLARLLALLMMAVWFLGIRSDYKMVFWRYLFHVFKNYPHRLGQALIHAVIGRHFILYTEEIMTRQRVFKPLITRKSVEAVGAGASEVPASNG